MNGMNGIEGILASIGIPETILQNPVPNPQVTENNVKIDFKSMLDNAIGAINDTEATSDSAIQQLAAGKNVELHDVMLAVEKASLTLQLAMEIKNKITDAYQTISSMQI